MKTVSPLPTAPRTEVPRGNEFWGWLGAAAPWILLAFHLRVQWSYEIERWFGFVVFPLAAYLVTARRDDAPAPGPGYGGMLVALVGFALLAASLPLLTVSPLWALPAWLAWGGAVLITLGLLARAGGWASARHFLFPLLFTALALPWPTAVQQSVVQTLRVFNASIAADLTSLLGRPTLAHGTLLETPRGWVGVAEACSGIAGLQCGVMLALLLGELDRLRLVRRVLWVVFAGITALLVNLVRTTALTWIAAARGLPALEAAHDSAAYLEIIATVGTLLLSQRWFAAAPRLEAATRSPPRPVTFPPLRAGAFAALGCLLLGLANELWFAKPAQAGEVPPVEWTLAPPPPGAGRFTLPAQAKLQLRYNEADAYRWTEDTPARDWIAVHLRWAVDPAVRYSAGLHRPELCLPAAGARLDAELGWHTLVVHGVTLRFRLSRFVAAGQAFYTGFCLWDPDRGQTVDPEEYAALPLSAIRWEMLRTGARQQRLEQFTVAVNRCRDDAEAIRRMEAVIPLILARRGP